MKKQKTPSLVTIGILTVITVIFWITFGVVRIFKGESQAVAIPAEILEPLNPTLDKNVVDKLYQRIYFDKGQDFETVTVEEPPVPEETNL